MAASLGQPFQPPNDGDRATKRRRRPWLKPALAASAVCTGVLFLPSRRREKAGTAALRADTRTVSVVVPALNEEKCIASTLANLRCLDPPPLEVIVSVGPSTDRTATIAKQWGARIVTGGKGRSVQMNAAAEQAKGDVLVFLHADTRIPSDALDLARRTLAERECVAGGFVCLIASGAQTFWGLTIHHAIKSFYAPLLFRPYSFFTGLRCLFGDQVIFCRRKDFAAVGGFDRTLPIMEDIDLIMRLHYRGVPRAAADGPAAEAGGAGSARLERKGRTRGRIRVVNRCVETDGRRFAEWGSGKATAIHFSIALAWYFGATGQQLVQLYKRLYGDIR